MNKEEQYYDSLLLCASRYLSMSMFDEELHTFVVTFAHECFMEELSLMKLNRWLGYIQGCLIRDGITTVEEERDWTRPLFKHLDEQDD